eukprot:PhF_6_TR11237/c0_g1_i1/m.18114
MSAPSDAIPHSPSPVVANTTATTTNNNNTNGTSVVGDGSNVRHHGTSFNIIEDTSYFPPPPPSTTMGSSNGNIANNKATGYHFPAPREPDQSFIEGPWGQLYRVPNPNSTDDSNNAMKNAVRDFFSKQTDGAQRVADDPLNYGATIEELMTFIDKIHGFARGCLFGMSVLLLMMFPTLGLNDELTGSNNYFFLAAYCESGVVVQKFILGVTVVVVTACLSRVVHRYAQEEINSGGEIVVTSVPIDPVFASIKYLDPHILLSFAALGCTIVTSSSTDILYSYCDNVRWDLGVSNSTLFPSTTQPPIEDVPGGMPWLSTSYAVEALLELRTATAVRLALMAAGFLWDQQWLCWRPRRPAASNGNIAP